ncbi:MAG TPA: hypothetical protein VLC09_01480 [Polyangiaceae bacterium]|nr:hypothetical protein [Polyangiaceae bacterium]
MLGLGTTLALVAAEAGTAAEAGAVAEAGAAAAGDAEAGALGAVATPRGLTGATVGARESGRELSVEASDGN